MGNLRPWCSLRALAVAPLVYDGGLAIATGVSTSSAIIVGGVVLAMAAPLFLVKAKVPVAV